MALLLDETSLTDSLIDAMEILLTENLITGINDDARAGLIRAGLLQQDPTLKKINILINPGGEDWPDILNTNTSGPDLHAPTYTIGGEYGTSFWRRRFNIKLDIFLISESDRSHARKKAQLVLHRCHHALSKWQVGKVKEGGVSVDSFGEYAFAIQICEMWIREGGGEGDYNWRGNIKIEVMTNHEPT